MDPEPQSQYSSEDMDKLISNAEENLLQIINSFDQLVTSSKNTYKPKPGQSDSNENKSVQTVSGELATKINELQKQMKVIFTNLPNDEPLRPSETEFDDFLINFTKPSLMMKIRNLGQILPTNLNRP